MSPDPSDALDPRVGFNRYAYVKNRPLSLTDPSGYFGWVGAAIGVALEVTRQIAFDEWEDVTLETALKNVGKIAVAGVAGAVGAGIAANVAKETAKIGAKSLAGMVGARAGANGVAGAGIGATSKVATNAIEGKELTDGVGPSAVIGGVLGAAGSVIGDTLTDPAQHLADATGNFIGTPGGQVAAPASYTGNAVGVANATSTVVSNLGNTVESTIDATIEHVVETVIESTVKAVGDAVERIQEESCGGGSDEEC